MTATACTHERDRDQPESFQRLRTSRRVVLTGAGAVTPLGLDVADTWRGVLAGRSGISPISRFELDGHRVRIAGEVHDFDAADWLELKDVKRLDRVAHLGLAAAQMAVDDAGPLTADPDRVATIFSSGVGGAATIARGVRVLDDAGPARVSPMFIPSSIANMSAGLIAMRFGFGGPNTCPVTACASSADAVGWGYRLVRDGYADACLAGGSEACVVPIAIAGFANIRALSTRNDDPQRACRPFDATRDGFVLSEGAAAVMIEPLESALARRAPIYAEICGYGQTADAYHETAPQPDGRGSARAIAAALAEAELAPADVAYVNAHGTSTPMSDLIETRALHRAFGEHAGSLAVSSTKSMTGHLLGATGALETIFTALALHDGKLPPTINHEHPDPECDLDYVPNRARAMHLDAAISNSMGFGGHNVCLAFRRVPEAVEAAA